MNHRLLTSYPFISSHEWLDLKQKRTHCTADAGIINSISFRNEQRRSWACICTKSTTQEHAVHVMKDSARTGASPEQFLGARYFKSLS